MHCLRIRVRVDESLKLQSAFFAHGFFLLRMLHLRLCCGAGDDIHLVCHDRACHPRVGTDIERRGCGVQHRWRDVRDGSWSHLLRVTAALSTTIDIAALTPWRCGLWWSRSCRPRCRTRQPGLPIATWARERRVLWSHHRLLQTTAGGGPCASTDRSTPRGNHECWRSRPGRDNYRGHVHPLPGGESVR